MSKWARLMRLKPSGLVMMPFAVITLVFASMMAVVIANDHGSLLSKAVLLVAGSILYGSAMFLLARNAGNDVRELATGSNTDALSKLPNRRELHCDYDERLKTNEEIAIAIIDLDGFKQVNDHFGHSVGDALIEQCANLIQDVVSKDGRCYRLGGDEFATVLSGQTAGTILEGICRSLLGKLETPFEVERHRITIGASIGLSRSDASEPVSSSEMLRRADVAMEMSKRGGKMRCTWFSETFDQRREAVREIEDDLRDGLAKEEFALLYQPLVHADTQEIVAVEALLRWNREDGRQVGPNVFVPIAEESGIINPIGLWVLREAMTDALHWGALTLSVNISAMQLRNPEFPIKLGEILEATGFDPERLELEVTETCLVLDPVIAERSLNVIREFGVKISLDDFGTGYASIGFLRQFRFEKLKLDRSLVVQAEEDDGSRAMMLSSIAVARALKMDVTAEGVETTEQADMVRLAGCDQLQGWLYFKALPAEEIDRLVAAQEDQKVQEALPLRS